MKSAVWSSLLPCVFLSMAVDSAAQAPVGALAIDERQGDQWGWAVDYETAAAAQERALGECGPGCSVVLTFGRCAAYAADQDANSTAFGWAEAYASADVARQAARAECGSRGGGSGCIVRAWGCNSPVVEEGVEPGLGGPASDPAGVGRWRLRSRRADGLFGPRTRAAIRRWQSSRGARSTGYLDGPSAEALRMAGGAGSTVSAIAPSAPAPVPPAQQPSTASSQAEIVFWQSIADSTNPAEFEAYLVQFPNGVFRALAQARLAALRSPGDPPGAVGTRVSGVVSPEASGTRVSGGAAPAFGTAAGVDVSRRPGNLFRDCGECPEMVVLPGGNLAMGRYEVTLREYRAFASATGGGAGDCYGDSWRDPGFPQTDRHPVTCVNWDDAQAYVSWLSRTTSMPYRLPTEAEWGRAAAGSQRGCDSERTGNTGTCPVGSYDSNGARLSDMVGNLYEWTADCWEGDCGRRVLRGSSWIRRAETQRPGARGRLRAGTRDHHIGFRVSRTLD